LGFGCGGEGGGGGFLFPTPRSRGSAPYQPLLISMGYVGACAPHLAAGALPLASPLGAISFPPDPLEMISSGREQVCPVHAQRGAARPVLALTLAASAQCGAMPVV
jgi:hypothetical protein